MIKTEPFWGKIIFIYSLGHLALQRIQDINFVKAPKISAASWNVSIFHF